jgi:serine/threonine protein kinase
MSALATLRSKISRELVYSAVYRRPFVPEDRFKELVTDDAVRLVLDECKITDKKLQDQVIKESRRVFAILARIRMVPAIEMLLEHGFNDEHLPIGQNNKQEGCTVVLKNVKSKGSVLEGFRNNPEWDISEIEDFCRSQWEFLAPVFGDPVREHTIYDETPLPIIEKSLNPDAGGTYGKIFKGRIHPAHQNMPLEVSLLDLSRRFLANSSQHDGEKPFVAIKEMHTKMDYELELNILTAVQVVEDSHLIKVVAGFQQGDTFYLIFEWADGGNLREFWWDNTPSPLDYWIEWSLQQMKGLARAIDRLHNFGADEVDNKDQNIRHGDLKPENIVRFKKPSPGLLQIADMGMGKISQEKTSLRESQEKGKTIGTKTYLSPEAQIYAQRHTSRADDMWSLGCIFLEFIVWLLYGPRGLEAFNASFFPVSFFVIKGTPSNPKLGSVRLQDPVEKWVISMYENHLKRENDACTSKALRDLLDFVYNHLLVEDPQPPPTTHEHKAKDTRSQEHTVPRIGFNQAKNERSSSTRAEATNMHAEPATTTDKKDVPLIRVQAPTDKRNSQQTPENVVETRQVASQKAQHTPGDALETKEIVTREANLEKPPRAKSTDLYDLLETICRDGKVKPSYFCKELSSQDWSDLPTTFGQTLTVGGHSATRSERGGAAFVHGEKKTGLDANTQVFPDNHYSRSRR